MFKKNIQNKIKYNIYINNNKKWKQKITNKKKENRIDFRLEQKRVTLVFYVFFLKSVI